MQNFADRLVGGDPARRDQRARLAVGLAKHFQPGAQAVGDDLDHALLKRCAEVAHVGFAQRRDLVRFHAQRRLESGKGKIRVRPPEHRPRQGEARGVAGQRLALDLRPAGVGQAKELRDLVEGFADRVVDGGAKPHIVADPEHRDDLGVAAGGEEETIGKRRRVGEPRGQRMRLEMVDRDQRLLGDERDRFRRGQPHDHAADQAGPGGGRDAVELGEGFAGFAHRLGDDQIERLDVRARRDFWHHAAERGMRLDLREHDVGENPARPLRRPLHHRRAGLIAGRFNPEDDHWRVWFPSFAPN